MSEPPVKNVPDGKASRGRGDDAQRSFKWFEPQKRRATIYEDVTVDTQPSPHRHLHRGWMCHFDDGSPTWSDDSTKLKSRDWYAFRDPGQQWERTFFQIGTGYERQIEGAVRSAADDRLFDDFEPEWVEFLRQNLQIPAFVDKGLWHPLATSARDTLSDTITHCVALQASMKQRQAQAVVLYAMDLEPHLGEMPIEPAKQHWLEDEAWQPARRYLEKLTTLTDWGETIVASNLCFEPLVGVLIRRELGIRAARQNGDTVTPVIANAAQLEWDWARNWTAELMQMVLADEEHGAHNKEVIGSWLSEWLPASQEAAEALAPIVDGLPHQTTFEQAFERVRRDTDELHEEAGVSELVGART